MTATAGTTHNPTRGMLDALYAHAFSPGNPSPAGVLVGSPGYGGAVLAAVIPTREPLSSHAAWEHIHRSMDAHYRGLDIIGFFAARRGGDGALTDEDEDLLERQFARDGQLAIILDTASHTGCVYARSAGAPLMLGGGPIAPRDAPAPPEAAPWRGATALALCGIVVGAVAHLLL